MGIYFDKRVGVASGSAWDKPDELETDWCPTWKVWSVTEVTGGNGFALIHVARDACGACSPHCLPPVSGLCSSVSSVVAEIALDAVEVEVGAQCSAVLVEQFQ